MSLRQLNGKTSLLRIYCGDFDRFEHHPLHQTILERARKAGLAGCTAFAGFWGYGSRGFIHTDVALEGAGEKPILIEIVDSPDRVQAFAKDVTPMLTKAGGLITEETVYVHHYQNEGTGSPGDKPASAPKKETPMERELTGENVLLRIFVGEKDKFGSKPLFDAIIERARKLGIAGCTVMRAVMGFGASSIVHKGHLFSQDNPMLIEVVDSADKVKGLLEEIRPMLQGALVTEEKVRVHHYTPRKV